MAEILHREAARAISCGGCPATWTGTGKAHCSGCHRTFSSPANFDRHRSAEGEHGGCLDPVAVVNGKTGERLLFERDGIWSGPEMTDEAKAAAFGGRAA